MDPVENLNRALGIVLRKHREERGIAQERYALDIGVNRTYVSLVERGKRNPTVGSLFRFADGLGIAPEQIIAEARQLMEDADGES